MLCVFINLNLFSKIRQETQTLREKLTKYITQIDSQSKEIKKLKDEIQKNDNQLDNAQGQSQNLLEEIEKLKGGKLLLKKKHKFLLYKNF